MARKKKSDGGGMSLDSLMDALTNVVAVLILVLVLVQADAAKTIQKYFDDLEPATEEELADTVKQLEQLEKKKKEAEDLLKAEAPDPELIKKIKDQILRLSDNLKESQSKLASLDKLRLMEEEVRKERDKEKKETEDFQKEIAMLESSLDETPILKPIPPADVSIPDSRPIPNNADIYYALVVKGRVHLIDTAAPLEEFEKVVQKNRNDWKLEKIKRDGKDLVIHDQEKITAFFKTYKFMSAQGHRIAIPPNPTSTRLFMDIYPDLENGGTPDDVLNKKQNKFHEQLQQLSRNRNAVVMFRVNPADFQTYLKARTVADFSRIPAGWEVNGDIKVRTWLSEVTVNRLKDPPPPDPNKPKPPPGPPGLKATLD